MSRSGSTARHRAAAVAGVVSAVLLATATTLLRRLAIAIGRPSGPLNLMLASPVSWPAVDGRTTGARLLTSLGQAGLLALVTGVACWLAARSTRGRRGFWVVLLGGWLGVVVGSDLAAGLAVPTLYAGTSVSTDLLLAQGANLSAAAAGWAIGAGWLVGLVAGLTHLRSVSAGSLVPSASAPVLH